MNNYWLEKYRNWKPILTFEGNTKTDWKEWNVKATAKLQEILGDFPDKTPLNAEVEYSVEEKDIIRERIVFDSEEFMSVPCFVLKPKTMISNRKNPAILCSHGHGPFGKEPVAGIRSGPEYDSEIQNMNYNYAEQMARAGFLTITPDLRVFGERSDGQNPFNGRDKCNVNFNKGALMGIYTLTLNIWDMMCCIDYLETRPEVDPSRIGMMGLSLGGTLTAFTTAVEKRIKAADIIGYINSWYKFAVTRSKFCGSQFIPQVYKYFDTHDIAGLIAPRPLLVEMGIYEDCFFIQDLLKGFEGIKKIYDAASVEKVLYKDVCPCSHAFAGNKAFWFFKEYL